MLGVDKLNTIVGRKFTSEGGAVTDTGISVNKGYFGGALLVLSTLQWSNGDGTSAQLDLVQLGYSNDSIHAETIKFSSSSSYAAGHSIAYGISSNKTLTIASTGGCNATCRVIMVERFT